MNPRNERLSMYCALELPEPVDGAHMRGALKMWMLSRYLATSDTTDRLEVLFSMSDFRRES